MQKLSPHFAYISVFSTSLVFSKLFFCVFRKFWDCAFPVISSFSIQKSTSIYTFISKLFSECWRGPLRWPVGLFQLRFPPWLKALTTQRVYNLIFLSNFLLGYTINTYNQVDSADVTCTTASLPRQMLTMELFILHFAMVGFRKLWVV